MYTVDAQTVVLLAEPDGWYVCTGRRSVLRVQTGPAEPAELDRRFHPGPVRLDCDDGCCGQRRRHAGGDRPDRQPSTACAEGAGRLWAAGVADGARPDTAVSGDGGRDLAPGRRAGPAGRWARPRRPLGLARPRRCLAGRVSPISPRVGIGERAPLRRQGRRGAAALALGPATRGQIRGTAGAPPPGSRSRTAWRPSVAVWPRSAGPGGLSLVDEAWHRDRDAAGAGVGHHAGRTGPSSHPLRPAASTTSAPASGQGA